MRFLVFPLGSMLAAAAGTMPSPDTNEAHIDELQLLQITSRHAADSGSAGDAAQGASVDADRPDRYFPHFDTSPDYLKIAAEARGINGNPGKVSDNYYLVLGDQGGANGGCEGCGDRQIEVAEKMKEYVAARARANPSSKLLFVMVVGDNFYWTGASPGRFKTTWLDIYGEELTSVPWFSVMGNHDYGNSDPGTACPWRGPRFVCDEKTMNTSACGAPRPYSTEQQPYASHQLNADKGGVDGELRRNYHAPDYTYYYTIPELSFELVAMDWNGYDLGGLGGDGPDKSASKLKEFCGGVDNLQHAMEIIKQASTELFNGRAAATTAKNVAIIGHYPNWSQGNNDFRDMFIERLPEGRRAGTKVFNFFGHAHTQVCFTVVDGECVNFQTGGGGGCCGAGDVPGGFVAIGWNDGLSQVTECFAPDDRCTIHKFAEARSFPIPPVADNVCDHTVDSPECPNYQWRDRGATSFGPDSSYAKRDGPSP